ncbi:MAG TPA: DUF2155 domain-containing protein [Pseudolabrys sp.]
MARSRLSVCILAIAAVSAASPALAQFGSIFTDEPPRPPANVPGGPPDYRNAPPYYSDQPPPPSQQRPYYPSRNDPQQVQQPYSDDDDAPRPPRGVRSDEPPAEPLPAPMNLPPSSRPGAGGIQTQDLAPPPGTEPSQAPAQAQPLPQPGQPQLQQGVAGTNPTQTLPGLPPGVRQPPGTPQQPGAQQPADAAVQPNDEIVVEPPPQRIANPTAVFSGLDKITGRIISFDVAINETVQFGALQVTPRVCYSRPPTETPNTDSFVEVDEVTLQGEVKRIFTGWMFSASPGLHAVEHPIYDVWLTECKGGKNPAVADVTPDAGAATLAPPPKPQPARPPAQRRTTPPPAQPRAQQQPQQPGLLPALR